MPPTPEEMLAKFLRINPANKPIQTGGFLIGALNPFSYDGSFEIRTKPMLPTAGQLLSISDDDLCSSCGFCKYQPPGESACELGWPGKFDDDGYVVSCHLFKP